MFSLFVLICLLVPHIALAAGAHFNTPVTIENSVNYFNDAGSTDAYAGGLVGEGFGGAAYVQGTCVEFTANTANTGAATLNINSISAAAIKKMLNGSAVDLANGDICVDQHVIACWETNYWQMITPVCNFTAGAGDALTTSPLSQFAATTSAQLAGVLSDEQGTGVAVFNIRPTLTVQDSTFTIQDDSDNTKQARIMAGAITTGTTQTYTLPNVSSTFVVTGLANAWASGIKQTFAPSSTTSGFNPGSVAGDPSAPGNGDLWYDSTANELTARINGVNTALGGGIIGASAVSGAVTYYPAANNTVDESTAIVLNSTSILSQKERVSTTLTTNTTLGVNDGPIVPCDATAGIVTLTLPAASGQQGHWKILKIDSSANACKVQRGGSDTINGGTLTVDAITQWNRVDVDATSATNWSTVLGVFQINLATQVTNILPAANLPIASAAETTTGTDATKVVTPDGLAGSNFGKRYVTVEVVPDATALTTGDGKAYFPIHPDLATWLVVGVSAHVGAVVSSSGAVTVDMDVCAAVATGIRCSGTNRDLLSTNITIDANEDGTETAAAAAVINTANDDLATGEWIRFNIDGAGTATQGLYVTIVLQKP